MRVPTRLTSLREVQWARFEPNFFAVFQPAALRPAPKQFVLLADVRGDEAVARLQRDVVTRYPNVASIDLSLVQRTVGRIVERVSLAVRFLGAFCLAMGVPVLFSAVAATRRDRLRDAVLLKTLGLPTTARDDDPKLKGLTPPWRQQLLAKSKEFLIDEEVRRRK